MIFLRFRLKSRIVEFEANPDSKAKALLFLRASLIVLACWFVYGPIVRGGWLGDWDDNTDITQNSLLRDPSALRKIWLSPHRLDYYPLKSSVQLMQWRLWGMNPVGYHLTNVALHLLSGFLLWYLLRKLGMRLAWLGGLLLVVHPMMVESVAWITELKNTLSLPFLLLAMIAWIRFCDHEAKTGSYLLSLVCFLAAMLSKTSVAMFPVVLLLYAWWKRGRITRRDVCTSAPFFVISLALGVVTLSLQHHVVNSIAIPAEPFSSRVAVAGLSIAFYLWKFLVPLGLMPIYPRWSVTPPSAAQFLPWLAIGGLVWFLWRTNRRGALFGLGAFLVNLVPASAFFIVSFTRLTWVMDHLAYVSMVGLIGLVVAAVDLPFKKTLAFWSAVSVTIGMLAVASRGYVSVFKSEKALWTYTVAANPGAWVAHNDLSNVLFNEGRLQEAKSQVEEALRLHPDFPEAENNLGGILASTGHPQEAIAHYRRALQIIPSYFEVHINLGDVLFNTGSYLEAIAQYEEALRLNPAYARGHNNLGVAFLAVGRISDARTQFKEAIRLDANYTEARRNLERLPSGQDGIEDHTRS